MCNFLQPLKYLLTSVLPSNLGDNSPAVKLLNGGEAFAIYNLALIKVLAEITSLSAMDEVFTVLPSVASTNLASLSFSL